MQLLETYLQKKHFVHSSYSYHEAKVSLFSMDCGDIEFCNDYFKTHFKSGSTIYNHKIYVIADNQFYNEVVHNKINFSDLLYEIPYTVGSKKHNIFYYIDIEQCRICIIRNKQVDYSGYIGMRVVRTCIIAQLEELGWMFLHSASVSKNEKGVVFIGKRFAGKTTTIMNLLDQYNYDYVSNDLIALRTNLGEVESISFPIALGIRCSTIKGIKKLQKINVSIPQVLSIDLINRINTKQKIPEFTQRVNYTVSDITKIMDCGIRSSSKVDTLFFLSYDANANDSCIQEIKMNYEKEELIQSQLVSIEDGGLFFIKDYYLHHLESIPYDNITSRLTIYKITHNDENMKKTLEFVHEYKEKEN